MARKRFGIHRTLSYSNPKLFSRSTSAYALFFREKQANEKRAAPYATFGQISQRIARQWDMLSEAEKKVSALH